MAAADWIDLLDPTLDEVRPYAPEGLPHAFVEFFGLPSAGGPAPRPRLLGFESSVLGVLLVPVIDDGEGRVYYQEIDLVITEERLLTIRKTPQGGKPFDPDGTRSAVTEHDSTGMIAYRLADEVAEAYLDLLDGIDGEIDELEGHVDDWDAARLRRGIADVRNDLLRIRRTLSPTRDAIRQVVDNRVEIESGEIFNRQVELAFGTVYDKLLRASEGLDFARDLLGGVRDYALARIANDQNETTKRLTALATILLGPTFIVGLYGQNFVNFPELDWRLGYLWSWALIVVSTALQIVWYRRKGWL